MMDRTPLRPQLLARPIDQTARLDYLLEKWWEWLRLEHRTGGQVLDLSRFCVDGNAVTCSNAVDCFRAFHNRQADVDSVPIENACEALCDDRSDSRAALVS